VLSLLCMSRAAYFISRIDWLVRARPAQRQRQVVRVGPRTGRHAPRAQAAGWARALAGTRHVRRRQTRASCAGGTRRHAPRAQAAARARARRACRAVGVRRPRGRRRAAGVCGRARVHSMYRCVWRGRRPAGPGSRWRPRGRRRAAGVRRARARADARQASSPSAAVRRGMMT
jgi:hypothetical protein